MQRPQTETLKQIDAGTLARFRQLTREGQLEIIALVRTASRDTGASKADREIAQARAKELERVAKKPKRAT